nr:hypothetical protein CFP56_52811 [Quercus suber]
MSSNAALQAWALPELQQLLPLDEDGVKQVIDYTATLSDAAAIEHLTNLLGDTPQVQQFATSFNGHRMKSTSAAVSNNASPGGAMETPHTEKLKDLKAGPPPVSPDASQSKNVSPPKYPPPAYASPTGKPSSKGANRASVHRHSNQVIDAANVRARDEQDMQQMLLSVQLKYGIYNSDIEPEHDTEYYCNCPIHQYQRRKWQRYDVQKMWSQAVMYPGEKAYDDNKYGSGLQIFSSNPYMFRVVSPYGYFSSNVWGLNRPVPSYHARSVHQTIELNNGLNREVSMARMLSRAATAIRIALMIPRHSKM